jgi:hypothetical protein
LLEWFIIRIPVIFITNTKKEIWDIVVNEMKVSDCDNVFDFISQTFNKRSKEVETPNQFEAMLVWYAAERIASEVNNGRRL